MSDVFDIVVIGAGPGGYVAAIRAAQLGFKVACVEEWKNPQGKHALGGTCLNVGCIPSKALLASSEEFEKAQHQLEAHGITVGKVGIDIAKMMARKDAIVTKMTGGIEYLFRKNKVTWFKGHGRFTEAGEVLKVSIHDGAQEQTLQASAAIIATGSTARHLPDIAVDNVTICDNEGALAWQSVPKRIGVIGAGVIGLELGSVWRRLGAEVTILEAMPTFLAAADVAVQKEAAKAFKGLGLEIHTGVKIGKFSQTKSGVKLAWQNAEGQDAVLECDKLIVSIGRKPNTSNLGLDVVGIKPDERGFIPVDNFCRTVVPNIFAIGDVVRGPMLAHKAEDEGVMVAETLASQKPHIDYNTIPWVIYTSPEIAWVGKNEQQLQQEGVAYKSGQVPFAINGRAIGMLHTGGFIKMLADAQTDAVLGVHIIGASASDLITEAVLAMEFKASSEDIARCCHAHPSLSEIMREAAMAVQGRAINF